MRSFQRVSDVIEVFAEKALVVGIGGVGVLFLAGLANRYLGGDATTRPLVIVLAIIGLVMVGFAAYHAMQIRKVVRISSDCPYCTYRNELTAAPDSDFLCQSCNRLIPVKDGDVLKVSQVRCGFCNGLNYYSEKTEVLLCEECNREIPIATDDDDIKPKKKIASGFAVVDDDSLYELILTGKGGHTEDLISTLQHMLALNRNQVKQMLDELPVTMLTGITKKKAEMLQAQLSIHDGQAEIRPISDPSSVR